MFSLNFAISANFKYLKYPVLVSDMKNIIMGGLLVPPTFQEIVDALTSIDMVFVNLIMVISN